MNPGGSVKDRTAKGLIMEAERQGLIKPGDTIVEGTGIIIINDKLLIINNVMINYFLAGNTGIGICLIAAAKGYKTVMYPSFLFFSLLLSFTSFFPFSSYFLLSFSFSSFFLPFLSALLLNLHSFFFHYYLIKIMYVPDNQSQEKIDVLRTLGAEVIVVPTVPFNNINHFYHSAKRRASEYPNTYFPDQVCERERRKRNKE